MPDCGIISLFLFVHLSRHRFRHPIGPYLCSVEFQADYRRFPFYLPCLLNFEFCIGKLIMTHSCMHLIYLTSELSCEYFQSTHLACWFGQMLTKAISWMKSLIASPTPRGIPVSLVRPWIWSLFYIRFRYPINSSSLTSTLDELPVRSQVIHHLSSS